MDLDELRLILRNSGVDVWSLIDTAISVAVLDYRNEIRDRRDSIVEKLYASPITITTNNNNSNSNRVCNNPEEEEEEEERMKIVEESREMEKESRVNNNGGFEKRGSPWTPQSNNNHNEVEVEAEVEEEDEEEDDGGRIYGRRRRAVVDEEQMKILDIKEQLEDPNQSEENLVQLLQELHDMEITFKALKETDIGRHVNTLRKHPSNEVCRMVKLVVRKWKYLVDAWVKGTSPGEHNADGDSPQQNPSRKAQNGRQQVPDFNYSPSPNPHNGSSGSEKNNSEPEPKRKPTVPRREAQTRPSHSPQVSNSAAPPNREQKSNTIDPDRLASARKRLQNNYQEAQNAKKNRTIQVMDLHDIPKPKNSFFSKNKGGSQARHW
ncbi:hypothetical protein ACHQM5_022160 [Ranunculus cassubicifolius]